MPLIFKTRTGGSVVEFSPATREARVRFPASARLFLFFFFTFSSIKLAAQPVHDNLIFFSLHSRVLS